MYEDFIFDTYALIEILKKNPDYEKYVNQGLVINDFIFSEFCYILYRNSNANAGQNIQEIEGAIVHPSSEVIKNAMKFRYKNKQKNLSITDCVSYFMSLEMGIKFLTGDKEFKGMKNVEFVK